MTDLQLSCRCGKVKGKAKAVKPGCGTRMLCYCNDCRNFVNHLQPQGDDINEFGGAEILHIPQPMMQFDQGTEHLACLRFSEKGLYRWYTACCHTPIGCMIRGPLPFIGLSSSFIAADQDVTAKVGPIVGAVYTQFATQPLPAAMRQGKSKYPMLLTIISKLILWKLQNKVSPNPFVDQQGKLLAKPEVIEFKG